MTTEQTSLSSFANQSALPIKNLPLSQMASTGQPQGASLSQFAIPTPQNVQGLIQQTADATLDPLRQGFDKRVDTLTGSLARRGVLYGGTQSPSAQSFADMVSNEQQTEANVMKTIGAQFGGTLLENALKANDLAQQQAYAKEMATFNQGLQYGTDPTTGKPLSSLAGDVSKASQLQGLQYGTNPTTGTPITQTQAQIDLATATRGLDVGAQKELATFNSNLDTQQQQTMATFMSGLNTAQQKDMASYMATLDTNQSKELASFTANLNAQNQKDFASFTQSLKNGINADTGQAYTDADINKQMTQLQVDTEKTLFNMKNSATRGVNPTTGQAYTDQEMQNIAFTNQKDMMDKENALKLKLSADLQALTSGVNADGSPMTQLQVEEKMMRMKMDIQNEYAQKAVNDALVTQYGPAGIDMAKDMANKRGDNLKTDMKLLTTIESDSVLTESQKSDITRLILAGKGWESDEVKAVVGAKAGSSTFQFLKGPDFESVMEKASKQYLSDKGFRHHQSDSGYDWIMEKDEQSKALYEKLWKTDANFRAEVAKYL
jgi:hypothetical protein